MRSSSGPYGGGSRGSGRSSSPSGATGNSERGERRGAGPRPCRSCAERRTRTGCLTHAMARGLAVRSRGSSVPVPCRRTSARATVAFQRGGDTSSRSGGWLVERPVGVGRSPSLASAGRGSTRPRSSSCLEADATSALKRGIVLNPHRWLLVCARRGRKKVLALSLTVAIYGKARQRIAVAWPQSAVVRASLAALPADVPRPR
jgi:hypothetical protein